MAPVKGSFPGESITTLCLRVGRLQDLEDVVVLDVLPTDKPMGHSRDDHVDVALYLGFDTLVKPLITCRSYATSFLPAPNIVQRLLREQRPAPRSATVAPLTLR